MALRPEEIDAAKLSRARLGGYDVEQTHELLRQVAWDYGLLLHERDALAERTRSLEQEVADHAKTLDALQAEVERRKHPDELARSVLEAAQQHARELRETTRAECELALEKAQRRAGEIETEVARSKASLTAEIARLEAERDRVRGMLRTALTDVLAFVERGFNGAALDGKPPDSARDSLVQDLRPNAAAPRE